MSVGGIDFGNESCTVALARMGGIDVVTNDASNRSTPSVVSFDEKQRWVGEGAANNAIRNFRNTIIEIKRILGKKFDDEEFRSDLPRIPYRLESGEDGEVRAVVNYAGEQRSFAPEAVLGTLFAKLKSASTIFNEGSRVVDFVVSVPSYFGDSRRRALANAMKIGGLNCLGMMNETTAAALDYGIFRSQELPDADKAPENVMFVDFGHSALSVCIASFVKGQLTVLAHSWDTRVGTRTFDWLLVEHFAAEFLAKTRIDLREHKKSRLRLLRACEKLKRVLSANVEAPISVECLHEERDFQSRVTREVFEEMCGPYMDMITDTLSRCLKDAGLDRSDLAAVEIIGGGSRIPFFKRLLSEVLELPMRTRLNASESIARGCAIHAAVLSPAFRVRDFAVKDVSSYPVSIRWDGREKDYDVFPVRNGFPSSKKLTLNVKQDFSVRAFYPPCAHSQFPEGSPLDIGTFAVSGIPARDGTVKVVARITSHGVFNVPLAEFVEIVEVEERVLKKKKDEKKTKKPKKEEKDTGMKPSPSVEAVEDKSPSPVPQVEDSPAPMEAEGGEEGKPAPMEEDTPKKADGAAEESEGAAPATDVEMEEKEEESEPEYEIRKRKKKVVKTLPVTTTVHALSERSLRDAIEEEGKMAAQDRLVHETAESRNAVESYVYEMRGRLLDQLSPYVEERPRTQFVQKLDGAEDWLYGDGEDCKKSVYIAKLNELRSIGDPIVFRFQEDMDRPTVVGRFVNDLEALKARALSDDDSLSHITAEEKGKVVASCDAALRWMDTKVSQQSESPKSAVVVIKCAQIDRKRSDVLAEGNAVLNKPKPPPPKAEKPEETTETPKEDVAMEGDAEEADGPKPATEDDATPMEVDPAPDVPDGEAAPMDLD